MADDTPLPSAYRQQMRRRRTPWEWVDIALTPPLLVWCALQVALMSDVGPKPAAYLVGGLVVSGLAFRRSFPVAVGWGTRLEQEPAGRL